MIRRNIICWGKLLCLISGLFLITSCNISIEKKEVRKSISLYDLFSTRMEAKKPASRNNFSGVYNAEVETASTSEDIETEIIISESKAWVNEHVDKDFLLGKVKRKDNPLFVKVDEEHTERNIFLIPPVYEAYKKMYEAALADGVKLKITSGHRTFVEQVCEWELRWNNPNVDTTFANDIEKARFVLQYRSMPGTSRHHWGTDIDLNSFKVSYFETKEGKKVYDWLSENAADYGFYQSYTALDENRPTGYQEEKWHWSYQPLARLMLDKYLELIAIEDISGFKGDVAAQKLPIISDWVCGINPVINDPNLLVLLDD